MCDKVIIENYGMLMFICDSYNVQKICDNAVDNYAHTIVSVPDCYVWWSCWLLSVSIKICSWLVCYKWDDLKTL